MPSSPPPLALKSYGMIGNADHVILRSTLQVLLNDPALPAPSFVMEDEGTTALKQKTMWYNSEYFSKRPASLPTCAEMCASRSPPIPHFTTSNCNSSEALDLLKPFSVQVLVLANTRIVKPPLLSIPTVTSLNCHGAYLPTKDPRFTAPFPSGYLRGALVFLFAVLSDAPTGLTLHHVLPAIDAGRIVQNCAVPVRRGDEFTDLIGEVVSRTAALWCKGLKEFDGTNSGAEQDESMFPDATCRRSPKTPEGVAELCHKVDEVLKGGKYSWFVE